MTEHQKRMTESQKKKKRDMLPMKPIFLVVGTMDESFLLRLVVLVVVFLVVVFLVVVVVVFLGVVVVESTSGRKAFFESVFC